MESETITAEQIKILDKLFGKDEFGGIPKAIKTDDDYKILGEIFSEDE